MLLYKQLHEKLNYLEADRIEQIYQAYLAALEYHAGQTRNTGEQYIIHPIAVATILADMHLDYQSIIAALLHDVIEDTCATKEEIADRFDRAVADLVDGVTKLSQIESSGKDETQAQNFRKMVLAMSRDIRVILIKLADRLHNMETIKGLPDAKRRRIAKETLDIYAPIANRLGMYKVYVSLEDLAFEALYPRRCRILKKAVEQVYGRHKDTIQLLDEELQEAFSGATLDDIRIVGRTKHLYGIYKKMLHHKASFANIMDVYAFRIIVQTVDDCYRALGVVHNLYKPLPGKFKDYIAIPKYNGYQSLHTVLFGPYGAPVEIQIRSKIMDQMASSGIAAHWLYKTGDETLAAIHMRAQQWVNKLIEMQQSAGSSTEFFENVKIDLFPDKVYVFTPKGDIMELMKGATIVDFAYAVHTDVGDTCVAARVNRRFLPLSTVLLNGQTVSIITSKKSEPNPSWLNFVVTGKARNNIRQYLRNKKKDELITLGRQLLKKAFDDIPFDIKEIDPEKIQEFLKKFKLNTLDYLYEDIGLGNRLATLVAYQLINRNGEDEEVLNNGSVKPLMVRGAEGVAITFAKCCCPIPGDNIVGYFNAGYGLEVHVEGCKTLAKLRQQSERCLPVSWADDVVGDFQVAISVEFVDQLGALAELTKAISKANANISDISSDETNGDHAIVRIHVVVKNLSHFERVKRYISGVPAVVGVVRRRG